MAGPRARRLMRAMNRHHRLTIAGLALFGYCLHLLYEVLKHWHAGKPFTLAEFGFLAGLAAIVWVGAGVAGWAVDVLFTRGEKDVGEID